MGRGISHVIIFLVQRLQRQRINDVRLFENEDFGVTRVRDRRQFPAVLAQITLPQLDIKRIKNDIVLGKQAIGICSFSEVFDHELDVGALRRSVQRDLCGL